MDNMSLETALNAIAGTENKRSLHRNTIADLNAEVVRLEDKLGLPHSLPTLNVTRLRSRIEMLNIKIGASNMPSPAASSTTPVSAPTPVSAAKPAPTPVARQFESCGDRTIDAAVREAGCFSLAHYKARAKRDELAALLATSKPGSFGHECYTANLSKAEIELKKFE